MTPRSFIIFGTLSVAVGALTMPVEAQAVHCQFRGAPEALADRPSPLDSVSIRLGDGEAKLCYGRPSARGRTMIGGVDPLGQPWRMGANEPTTLHVPFPARLGSVDLEPGAYSLYAIPGATEWTIVVNANVNRWGIPISPDVRSSDVGSFVVQPTESPEHEEMLTFSFVGADAAGILTFRWEGAVWDVAFSRR